VKCAAGNCVKSAVGVLWYGILLPRVRVRTKMKPKLNRPAGMDVCQTPPYALQPLYPYLDKGKQIWESACGPDKLLVTALEDAGYWVTASDIETGDDFFDVDEMPTDTIQVTNPPFSQKYKWLEHSFELGPFALLLPYETTFAKAFQLLCRKYRQHIVKVLSPERRIDFKMPNKGWGGSAQMPTCWITWGLPRCMEYVEPDFYTYYCRMDKEKME